jgi:hypothetical protein
MRTTLALATVLALGVFGATAHAACPVNPAGGPNELDLVSTGTGSDLDLGTNQGYQNIKVPGGSEIRTCLGGCDASTNPVCQADGTGVNTLGDAFSPPAPIFGGNPATPVCVVVTFSQIPTGTANVQTGDIDMHVGLDAQAYILPVTTTDNICPRCSGANVGDVGTCDTGARAGQACTTDAINTVIGFQTSTPVYNVSRDCLPSGAPSASVTINDIPLTTSTAKLTGSKPCAGQAQDDNCGNNGPCTGTCTGSALNGGGVAQYCCAAKTTRACFPTGAGSIGLIERDGTTSPATPLWPDPTYEKTGDATLVTAFCVPTTHNVIVDLSVGLPGPLAMIVPLTHDWLKAAAPPTTTTTTSLPAPTTTTTSIPSGTTTTSVPGGTTTTTTLPQGCTSAADCDDHDDCTTDTCNQNVCAHAPVNTIDCAGTDLGALTQPQVCGAETVSAKLEKKIANAVAKAQKLLDKAKTAKPKKAPKLVAKAEKGIQALENAITKAESAKKNPISQACGQTLKDKAELARMVMGDIF